MINIKKTSLSREDLVKQAPRLVAVLRALRKTHRDITSDSLWENILQRWSANDLERALKRFEKSGKLDEFKKLLEPLPQADKSGFFVADGEAWGTVSAIAAKLEIGGKPVARNRKKCRHLMGRVNQGNHVVFYSLSDMEKACAVFKQDLPKAGKDGFISLENEEWGTLYAICESLKIGRKPIEKKARELRQRVAFDRSGRPQTFYALSDVRETCASLLKKFPQAKSNGFFKIDGEVWGTVPSLSRKLRLCSQCIYKHAPTCRSRTGIDPRGAQAAFYALSDIKRACKGLLNAPLADRTGFFKHGREIWGTKIALAKRLGLHRQRIAEKIGSCRKLVGKTNKGRPVTFYPLSDVTKACSDYLNAPQANRTGYFKLGGETWGLRIPLAKLLGVNAQTVTKRASSCRKLYAKTHVGRLELFYSLSDLQRVCADLIAKKRPAHPVAKAVLTSHAPVMAKVLKALRK